MDAKDWQGLQRIRTDPIALDYVSLRSTTEKIPSLNLVEQWKKFVVPLKATQHLITNLKIKTKDETAECVADVLGDARSPKLNGRSTLDHRRKKLFNYEEKTCSGKSLQ